MTDIVERLRNTPNWMREPFAHWKDAACEFDRAPFEAADEITRLTDENEALRKDAQRYRALKTRHGYKMIQNLIGSDGYRSHTKDAQIDSYADKAIADIVALAVSAEIAMKAGN